MQYTDNTQDQPRDTKIRHTETQKKGWGPGPALGPWKLLGFPLLNMHSPCFLGIFL